MKEMYRIKRIGQVGHECQRGQALTEFLVVAQVLVPLFLLLPVIAKYQDISNATQLASRYVAFEAMARNDGTSAGWKPVAELANDVRMRFFANPNASIKTQEGTDDALAHQNLFWRDPQNKSLIKAINNDVSVSFGSTYGSVHSDAFSSADDGATFLNHDSLGLQSRGIYTANVSVKLANLPSGLHFYEPFNQIGLTIRRGTSVLIDPWAAKNAPQIESKIAAAPTFFPTGSLSGVSSIVDANVSAIDVVGGLSGPKLGRLDFWTDVVPADRLRSR